MTEIPTSPCDDPADTIMAAIAHGMQGNHDIGLTMLGPFIQAGARTTVSMLAALASMVAANAEKQNPGARGTFGLLALHHGTPADMETVPPGLRFAGQFATAWANGQEQTAYALFESLVARERAEDAANLAEGVLALYGMAVESAKALRDMAR